MLSSTDTLAAPSLEARSRLLVAIASFGEKNIQFLKRIIRNYRAMAAEVDVVVFSNAPKDLGPGVKVIVGLPSKDPWSLPFAHKAYFAENVDRYDLFIYSEDDMDVTEENIRAFLRLTPELEPDEIAGYLRFEADEAGNRSLPEVHGPFHWRAGSVRRRGSHTIAEFTNEHAAFYLLTRHQLRKIIASGGFLREPCKGKYDMLCTAATDPYTNCGFRKVICISALDQFLIHHLSNRYTSQLGLSLSALQEQVQTLMEIAHHGGFIKTIDGTGSGNSDARGRMYYEGSNLDLLELIPTGARTVLSVGCGWGATESLLKQRGVMVTAIPLDSIIAVTARGRGIEVVDGTFDECLQVLNGRSFDCVLVTNLFHLPLQPADALEALEQCFHMVRENGTLIVSGPNLRSLPHLLKSMFGRGHHRDTNLAKNCDPHRLTKRVRGSGFRSSLRWFNHSPLRLRIMDIRCPMGMLTARNWAVQARRES